MVWHIFRKDLVLLWPVVALSAIAQFGLNAMMFVADRSPDSEYLLLMARLFVIVVFLVITLAIALGVHQDPIPGTRQDWLIRPIRRRDLLAAKLLFVLAAVQLPMLVGDLVEAMAQGFSWREAVTAALSRNLFVLVTLSLPAFGFAAMTRNTAQFIGVGVVYVVAITAATFLLSNVARINGAEQASNPLFWTGVAWVQQTVARLALAAGAIVALLLLYFRRRVALARGVLPAFAALSVLATFLPWGWLFAVQAAASGAPAPGQAVGVSFDPQAPRYRALAGEGSDDYAAGAAQVQLRGRSAGDIEVENKVRHAQGDVTIFIPLRIGGLPAGALAWADRAEVSLRSQAGQVVFQGRGDELKLERTGAGSPVTRAYEAIRIPALVYEASRDKALTLEIAYSMTVLRARPPVAVPALGAVADLPGVGRCTSGRDSDGDDIVLRCLQAGRAPSCVSATLADSSSGRRNPETLICAPDYSPYNSRPFPDAISRFEVEAPFRDRLGLGTYPVGGAQLGRAQLVLTSFEASQHLTRHVTAVAVRLSDWTAINSSQGAGKPGT